MFLEKDAEENNTQNDSNEKRIGKSVAERTLRRTEFIYHAVRERTGRRECEPIMNEKVKVVWITYGPFESYVRLFDELGKIYPGYDLTMIVVRNTVSKKRQREIQKGAKTRIIWLDFDTRAIRLLAFPYLTLLKIRGKLPDTTLPGSFDGLDEFLEKERPDVVIGYLWFMPATWQAARYCRRRDKRFLLFEEMKRFPLQAAQRLFAKLLMRILRKLIFKQTERILPLTKEGLAFSMEQLPLTPEEKRKITLLPAPIAFGATKGRVARRASGKLRILMVARFVPYKRHDDLIAAVAALSPTERAKVRITFIGKGPLRQRIEELAQEKGVDAEFIEQVPHEQMTDIYARHDALVLPSHNEAIGFVVIEAMVSGLSVIVSDTVGATTYIEEGKTGLIFKTGDPEDLAARIRMLFDTRRRQEIGARAQKEITKNYSVGRIALRLDRIIRGVDGETKI